MNANTFLCFVCRFGTNNDYRVKICLSEQNKKYVYDVQQYALTKNQERLKVYYVIFPSSYKNMQITFERQEENHVSKSIQLNNELYQFLYDFNHYMDQDQIRPILSNILPYWQLMSMKECIDSLFPDNKVDAIYCLYKDSCYRLSKSNSNQKTDFAFVMNLMYLQYHSDNINILLQCFDVSHNYDYTLTPDSKPVLLKLIENNYQNGKYNQIDKFKDKILLILVMYYMNYTKERKDYLQKVINCILQSGNGLLYLPRFIIEAIFDDKLVNNIERSNLILSKCSNGKTLFQMIEYSNVFLSQIYSPSILSITNLINISKQNVLEDLIYLIQRYFKLLGQRSQQYSFVEFRSNVFEKYIEFAITNKNIDIIDCIEKFFIEQLEKSDHRKSSLFRNKCDDAKEKIRNNNIDINNYHDDLHNNNQYSTQTTNNDSLGMINFDNYLTIDPPNNNSQINSSFENLNYFKNIDINQDYNDNYLNNARKINLREYSNNDLFIQELKTIPFDKIFKDHYLEFVHVITSNLELSSFSLILDLIPKEKFSKEIMKELTKSLESLLDKGIVDFKKFADVISRFIKILNKDQINDKEVLEFLQLISSHLSLQNKFTLYYQLKDWNGISMNIYKSIQMEITESFQNFYPDELIKYLNSNRNKEALFDNLIDMFFQPHDFYSLSLSNNFILFQKFLGSNFFENNNVLKKVLYYEKSLKSINQIKQQINDASFTFEEAIMLIDYKKKSVDNFQLKISVLALNNQQNGTNIYNTLLEKLQKVESTSNKITSVLHYYQTFFPSQTKIIVQIDTLYKSMMKIRVCDIERNNSVMALIKKDAENAQKYNKLYSMQFFIGLYDSTVDQNEKGRLEKAEADFNIIQKWMFEAGKIDPDEIFAGRFLKRIETKATFDQEFKKVKDHFGITNHTFFLENKLFALSLKQIMSDLFKGILFILKQLEFENPQFEKKINEFQQSLQVKLTGTMIETIIHLIRQYSIDIINKNKIFTLIILLSKNERLLPFIRSKKEEDIRNIIEFIDDTGDSFIKVDIINDLISLYNYVQKLYLSIHGSNKNNAGHKKPGEIEFFKSIELFDSNKNIEGQLIKILENYADIEELFKKILNKEEFSKQKIIDLRLHSVFNFDKNDKGIYSYTIKYNNKVISYEDVMELRERALLFSQKKDLTNEITQDFVETCNQFCDIVNDLLYYKELINDMTIKGYPADFTSLITIKGGYAKIEKKELKDVITDRINQLKILKKETTQSYEEYPLVRFFYGKHFYEFYNTFLSKTCLDSVNQLLKYITDNKCNIKPTLPNGKIDNVKTLFKTINDYLLKVIKENNLTVKNIYSNNNVKQGYKGIYLHYFEEKTMEKDTINLYYSLTNHIPLAQTILICNEYTSKEEIKSFLYRSLRCEFNVLFYLVKSESLKMDKRKYLIKKLTQIYNHQKQISLLVFGYYNKKCDVIIHLRQFDEIKEIQYSLQDGENILKNLQSVEIVTSAISGVGKTRTIFEDVKMQKKKYIYFPLGGDFTSEDIISRFKKITFDNETIIHLDLINTKKILILKDFLFHFLVLRYYSYDNDLFYVGNEISIKVEIPNGFVDYFELFPLLSLLPGKKIEESSLSLIVDQNLTSNMQIIFNYLKYIGDIDGNNLYFKGLSENNNQKNKIEASVISQDKCNQLFKDNFTIKNPNYYQMNSFINVLGEQLRSFTNNIYLAIDNDDIIIQSKKLRSLFVKSFLANTQHFTKGEYDSIIKYQKLTHSSQQQNKIDDAQGCKDLIEAVRNQKVISFGEIKPSLVFFNNDGQSLSIITTELHNSDEYKQLWNLWNTNNIKTGNEERDNLVDYRQLQSNEYKEQLFKVFDIKPSANDKWNQTIGTYVFTEDNFIKMIFILLRIQANIPVILMGETGCGKTSLIEMISKLKKNIKMIPFNIHAGIDDNDIINFMNNKVLSYQLQEKETSIWVFLDEINTCNSLGLISEMMCHRTMRGQSIKNHIVFIGACNPYREYTNTSINVGLLSKHHSNQSKLVYNVHPLPYSLLNYVFNFGSLSEKDEERYIQSIIEKAITEEYERPIQNEKSRLTNATKSSMIKMAVQSIVVSHKFIREKNEVSSVSLREIKRFVLFYKWFIGSIKDQRDALINNKPLMETDEVKYYDELTSDNIQRNSIILAIYICYYLRIATKETRKEFINMIKPYIQGADFESIVKIEQMNIARRIKLAPGIALNSALLQNLFTLFVCVSNKIPVFICGKPGCSKSLSVHLLFKAMRGEGSEDHYFKTQPKLFMNCYQGSLTSTSKGVLRIFQKAKKMISKDNQSISMIFFDEMGLAEISKNNPLKVIHSELEYDANIEKVAFVGISNWCLDASKMNRGVFLSIPDLDEEDLKETAKIISKSYERNLDQFHNHIQKLATVYYAYKKALKEKYPQREEFHGSRDFYYLIKLACKLFLERSVLSTDLRKIEVVCDETIERNFGGLPESITTFKSLFYSKKIETNDYNVLDCIKTNFTDKTSRYVMIISKASISTFLVKELLKDVKQSTFFIGSQFEEDLNQEYYSAKIINKVQQCMEQKEHIIVMKNLESIYPSLYDVFNQNYTSTGNRNYARIALGTTNNAMAFINDGFRCAILLDENEIDYQDPPFLNRFEKHILSFEYLIRKELCNNAQKIYQDIQNSIKEATKQDTDIKFNLKAQLINADIQEIQGLVYKYDMEKIEPHLIPEMVFSHIAPTLSQDIIGFYSLYNNQINDTILKKYKEKFCPNLSSFLEKIPINRPHNLIYTFSEILTSYKIRNQTNNSTFGSIKKESVDEKLISNFSSEDEIEGFLKEYYRNNEKNLCMIKFRPCECIHLAYLICLIERIESILITKDNQKVKPKLILLIIHFKRQYNEISISEENQLKEKNLVSNITIHQQFIDDLYYLSTDSITNFTDKHNKYLFNNFIKTDKHFDEIMIRAQKTIAYTDILTKEPIDMNYSSEINKTIFKLLRPLIEAIIEKEPSIKHTLYSTNMFESDEISIISLLEVMTKKIAVKLIIKYLVHAEQNGAVFAFEKNSKLKESFEKICSDYFKAMIIDNKLINTGILSNPVTKITNLQIPFLLSLYNSITEYFKKQKKNSLINMFSFPQYKSIGLELKTNIIEKSIFKSLLIDNNNQEQEIWNLLQEDIQLIFITTNFGKVDKVDEIILTTAKTLINLSLKIDKELLLIDKLTRLFLFLVLYEDLIIKVLKTFDNLPKDTSKQVLNKINTEKSNPNQNNEKEGFRKMIDSLLDISLTNIQKKPNQGQEILEFVHNCDAIITETQIVCHNRNLLQSHIEVENMINNSSNVNNNEKQELLNKYYSSLGKNKEKRLNSITNFFKDPKFNNNPQVHKVWISILGDEVYQNNPEEILKIITDNHILISNSFVLLQNLFKDKSLMKLCNNQINNEQNDFLKHFELKDLNYIALQQFNSPALDEMLMFIFERNIINYFNIQSNNNNQNGILEQKSLMLLSIALDYINENFKKNDKKYHLGLLYAICFVKVYFFYYINFLFSPNKTSLQELSDTLIRKKQDAIKDVFNYGIKYMLFNKMDYYQQLKVYDRKQNQLNWFAEELKDIDDYELNYLFLDIQKCKDYETLYTKITQQNNNIQWNECNQKENILLTIDCLIRYKLTNYFFNNEKDMFIKRINQSFESIYTKDNLLTKYLQMYIEPKIRNKIEPFFKNQVHMEILSYCYKLIIVLMKNNKEMITKEIFTNASSKLKSILILIDDKFILDECTIQQCNSLNFRILMMGLLSFVFFGQLNNDVSKRTAEDVDVIQKLLSNWGCLDRILRKRRIFTQIYLNSFLDSKNQLTTSDLIQDKPSNELNKLIESCLNNYTEYETTYKQWNYQLLQRTKEDIRTKIYELEKPSTYSFPIMKYFTLCKYPKKEDVISLMTIKENQEKYPLLFDYLNKSNDYNILNQIKIINETCNEISKQFCEKEVTRKNSQNQSVNIPEAFILGLNIILKQMNRNKNIIPEEKFKTLPINDWVLEKDSLLQFVYEYLIDFHNEKLQQLCQKKKREVKNKQIPIQEVKDELFIVNFSEKGKYKSFEDLIWVFSIRDCIEPKGDINYMTYQIFKYDLAKIEEEMTNLFLIGKHSLCKKFKYHIFKDEEYLHDSTNIILRFKKKVNFQALDKNQKQELKNKSQNITMVLFDDFKDFLNNIILTQSHDLKKAIEDKKVKEITKKNLDFYNLLENFQISSLVPMYEYMESLLYYSIILNLKPIYKIETTPENNENIQDTFEKNELKGMIAEITKRFIIRVLMSNNAQEPILPELNLFEALKKREDLYKYEDKYERVLQTLTEFQTKLPEIKVKHSNKVYLLLTDDNERHVLKTNVIEILDNKQILENEHLPQDEEDSIHYKRNIRNKKHL